MEITFGKFWTLLESKEDNSKSLNLIRSGNNIKKNDCGNFWDDFSTLCGNIEAMAELLDVPKEKVSSWSGNISKLRQIAAQQDSDKSNKKNRIIKKGDL